MIQTHNVTLKDGNLVLRPMSDNDMDLLVAWNSDPEVLYYSDGNDVSFYSAEDVISIYSTVSQAAYCFIIVYDDMEVGECWLQVMNLDRIKAVFPGLDCRRVDIMIGNKQFWGKGIGRKTIKLLVDYGFKTENADAIFACNVADYNRRSRKAFESIGFEVFNIIDCPENSKANHEYDLIIRNPKKVLS